MRFVLGTSVAVLCVSCAHGSVPVRQNCDNAPAGVDLSSYYTDHESCPQHIDGYHVADPGLISFAPSPVGWKFFLDGGNIVFVVGVDDDGNGERQGPEWCGESYSVDIDTCQLTVFPWPSNAESWHVVRRRGSENSAIRVDWSEGVAIFDRCTAVDPCWIHTPDYSCSLDQETP